MLEIERRVLGCDYGGTSWTTRDEAIRIREFLDLRPGARLLDVGSGSGWPALYLAKLAGCEVFLTDTPVNGLQIAIGRAKSDGLEARSRALGATGAALPFAESTFDAISHSDVLCCRRVLETGPPYVEAPDDYAVLLRAAGWHMMERIDVTNEFMRSIELRNAAMESTKAAVVALLGMEEFHTRAQRRQATRSAVADGLLRREVFVAIPRT